MRKDRMMKALLIVDIQNDFCSGGTLPVTGAEEIVPVINKLQQYFDCVVATQDWHPSNHKCFASNHKEKKTGDIVEIDGLMQTLWPVHCVQGSFGAQFHQSLDTKKIESVFQKGTDPDIDSYSGFFDNYHRKSTGLGDYLKKKGVHEVYIVGLATDYCVKFTALDAQQSGFKTIVIVDACKGVELKKNDSYRAIEEMKKAGVKVIRSDKILQ